MKLVLWWNTVLSQMTTKVLVYYRFQKFTIILPRYADWSKVSYRHSDFICYFHTIVKWRGAVCLSVRQQNFL